MSRLNCQWPGCDKKSNSKSTFNGREELEEHYRSCHQVHEFGWSQLLAIKQSAVPEASVQTSAHTQFCNRFVLNKSLLPSADEPTPSQLGPSAEISQSISSPRGEPVASSSKNSESSMHPTRYSMLPQSRRPEPTVPLRENEESYMYNFISPEPLNEPFLSTEDTADRNSSPSPGLKIPKSSLVPSYFLASTNRFTYREIASMIPSSKLSALVPPPLFVYGSLMFPSILKATAERFTSAEGTYSNEYQRRLKTDASDWSRINFSLQHAAERMTPARLRSYMRTATYNLSNANIRKAHAESVVQGFVLFGLSEEALKCCDFLLSEETLRERFEVPNPGNRIHGSHFARNPVEVDISMQGGDVMTIDAVTYEFNTIYSATPDDWDINRFVRSRTFAELSSTKQGSSWVEEETRLASIMGMTLVLSGDALCGAVVQNDKSKLLELLKEGHDIDAPCTHYGSALAAAAFCGQEELLDILIRHDANVDIAGGEYVTPLIAATTQGHEECVYSLLKARADVLAQGGKYISALYQAVDFGDVGIAKLLLEKGAWLTEDYRELLDLAAERGHRGLTRMLEDYDVRKLYLSPAPKSKTIRFTESEPDRGTESDSQSDSDLESEIVHNGSRRLLEKRRRAPSALNIAKAVGLQALYLKGQRGKWTGIKGVKLLQAAFEVGVPDTVLQNIRPHLAAYQGIVDFLGTALIQYQEEQNTRESTRSIRSQGDIPLSSTSRRRAGQQLALDGSGNGRRVSETCQLLQGSKS